MVQESVDSIWLPEIKAHFLYRKLKRKKNKIDLCASKMYWATGLPSRISITNTQKCNCHHSHFKNINKAQETHLPKATWYN